MDLILELPQERRSFPIEVGFFDTVLEIKEKVQKYHRIPIPKQTLIFNNRVLQDEWNIEFCHLLHNSRIQLFLPSEPEKSSLVIENSSLSNKIDLNIKIPANQIQFPITMESNDSVRRLKEKIFDMESVVPVNKMILQSNKGVQLQDHRSLREYELSDNAEIEVSLQSSPTTVPATAAAITTTTTTGSSKKLQVMVKLNYGSQKIAMEVNATDNVGELRKELQKLQQRMQNLHLPAEGFFFIYDRDVMDEERSFRWHGVGHGDTLEIFNGSVSGRS